MLCDTVVKRVLTQKEVVQCSLTKVQLESFSWARWIIIRSKSNFHWPCSLIKANFIISVIWRNTEYKDICPELSSILQWYTSIEATVFPIDFFMNHSNFEMHNITILQFPDVTKVEHFFPCLQIKELKCQWYFWHFCKYFSFNEKFFFTCHLYSCPQYFSCLIHRIVLFLQTHSTWSHSWKLE